MKVLNAVFYSIAAVVITATAFAQESPKLPGDAQIRPQIIGTWTAQDKSPDGKSSSKNVLRLTEQGDFSRQITLSLGPKPITVTGIGKWELKNGELVLTTLQKITPKGETKPMEKPLVNKSKIISINDHEFVISGMDPKSPTVYKR